MRHTLIISGGYLNIEFAKAYCKTLSYDKVFAVDKGLEYCEEMGVMPDYILGDFDTVKHTVVKKYEDRIRRQEFSVVLQRYPEQKDETDTELAITKAIEQGTDRITLLGATGSRLDHVLANIYLLRAAILKGVIVEMVDETNRIQILDGKYRNHCTIFKEWQHGKYVSLIPISEQVEGVTIEGAEYPLSDFVLFRDSSRAVSNQVVECQMDISLKRGSMLVIESKD